MTWEDWRQGIPDIYYANSSNGGVTFTGDVAVNDNLGDGSNQKFPAIDVGNDRRIHVAWYDERLGGGGDIFYANSSTSGSSFATNIRVNNDPVGLYKQELPAIAVGNNYQVHVVWMDTRTDTNYDIYYTHFHDNPIPEFSALIIPVVAVVALFVAYSRIRRKK